MKENSDKNTYDSETRIDELLNSFIDGELASDQRTKVEELTARDAGIAQRLRELQKCKTLLGALPRAEAPPQVLEGVKATLAQRHLQTRYSALGKETQKKYPRVRRVLAAAAMIGLVVVLSTVMRTMNAPQDPSEKPIAPKTIEGGFNILAPQEFRGRLELKTRDVVAVSASVNKAIENIHHSEAITPVRRQERRIYTLSCSKEDIKSLLANLEPMWPVLDTATLSVNTDVFGERITVEAVTTEQIATIIDQDYLDKRIETARDFSALNNITLLLPDRAIATAIEGQNKDLIHQLQVPKPALAQREAPVVKTSSQQEDKDTVHLTILVSR